MSLFKVSDVKRWNADQASGSLNSRASARTGNVLVGLVMRSWRAETPRIASKWRTYSMACIWHGDLWRLPYPLLVLSWVFCRYGSREDQTNPGVDRVEVRQSVNRSAGSRSVKFVLMSKITTWEEISNMRATETAKVALRAGRDRTGHGIRAETKQWWIRTRRGISWRGRT